MRNPPALGAMLGALVKRLEEVLYPGDTLMRVAAAPVKPAVETVIEKAEELENRKEAP